MPRVIKVYVQLKILFNAHKMTKYRKNNGDLNVTQIRIEKKNVGFFECPTIAINIFILYKKILKFSTICN